MININTRKVSLREYQQHLKKIDKQGYTIVRNFFSRKTVEKFLNLTKKKFKLQKEKQIKTPKVWNIANLIYNLQNKDINYVKLLHQKFFEKILIKKINDPHYRNAKRNVPNYILNNFIARSSGRGPLFLHIDSGIPTGDVTAFMQIMIPLEKIYKKNGCTVVVPKTHKSRKFSNRKTKKFTYVEGEPGDVFIWDGNLWHGSLPNKLRDVTRWTLVATFSNWQFKQVFDIPRGLNQKFYSKLNSKEKMLLGFCGIPSHDEKERVTRSIPISRLKKNVRDFYKIVH